MARIERLEAARRFVAPMRTKEEVDATAKAERERIRRSLIAGTYQHPEFKPEGLLTVEQQRACWDAWLLDIPEYAPYLGRWP